MAFGSGRLFETAAFWIGFALCCAVIPASAAPVSATDEIEANSVEIQFYLMNPSDWNEVEGNFKELIANSITKYCALNYVECGLKNWNSAYKFTSSEVLVTNVEDLKTDLNVTYFVKFSRVMYNTTSSVVRKAALLASVRENHKALNDVTDSDIIAAGEDSYSPEPNVTLNKIIIPIAIAVLFVLLIITVALYYYRKNQDLKESRQKKKLRKSKHKKKGKKQDRDNPVSSSGAKFMTRVEPAPAGRNITEQRQVNGHHNPPAHRDEDDSYLGNQTEETFISSADSHHRNTSLPPLDDHVQGERKKNKRHKKHQSGDDVPRSRPQEADALPSPPQYVKHYHGDDYRAEGADDSGYRYPPV